MKTPQEWLEWFLEQDPAPCLVDCEPVFDAVYTLTGLYLVRFGRHWRLLNYRGLTVRTGDLFAMVRRVLEEHR